MWSRSDSVVWLDLEQPEEADLLAVGEVLGLDAESVEDCLSGEQRPRIGEFEDYVFLVVYGLLGPDSDQLDPRKLSAFCGKRFLLTVHAEPLRTVRAMRQRCARNPNHVLSQGLDFVLYQIIDGMVDTYLLLAETYEHRIERLEGDWLDASVEDGVLGDASELRNELLEIRRGRGNH